MILFVYVVLGQFRMFWTARIIWLTHILTISILARLKFFKMMGKVSQMKSKKKFFSVKFENKNEKMKN